MRREKQSEHPSDEQLLAYLDGELAYGQMRTMRSHLKCCWKCRALQSSLEAQIELVSRLLSERSDIDVDHSVRAKERFLEWRKSIEERHGSSLRSWSPRLYAVIRLTMSAQCKAGMLPSLSPS
jgi:anti-sigma factor RsiW